MFVDPSGIVACNGRVGDLGDELTSHCRHILRLQLRTSDQGMTKMSGYTTPYRNLDAPQKTGFCPGTQPDFRQLATAPEFQLSLYRS
jgi:hypothetical protein